MVRYSAWLFRLCLAICLLSLAVASVQAAPPARPTTQSTPLAVNGGGYSQPIDVVVVLDDSGSMATCWPWPRDGGQPFFPPCRGVSVNPPSDPDELRYSAARLLLQLASDEDRVAVVRFDNAAEGVGELGALQPIGAGDNRSRLTSTLVAPDDYFRRGYTRIDLGLQAAVDLLQAAREPGRNQYVLLLTDGEPSSPQGFGGQEDEIRAQVTALQSAGVLVFPVVLCNSTAGCAGEFLREQLPELGARQAATAQDLLRVFSEIFAEMKPDLSLVSGRGTRLQLTTRAAHGVRKLAFVTTRDGLVSLGRDGQPLLAERSLDDPTIDVNIVEGEALTPGSWTAELNDAGGFVVVQSDSYPQLLNPPPSLANSPASVRYYPAGKPLLLIARSGGPGAGEPLLYNGETPLQPFAETELKLLRLTDVPAEIKLQVGEDPAPLQLVRTFRLEARRDLPRLEVFAPLSDEAGVREDGRALLQVGFSNADVQNLAATVFITDESNDEAGNSKLVYQQVMTCNDRLCTDENFVPGDGRSYEITYILQAQKEGLRFSDWGQATLSLKPAVQVRGLPAQLDLAQMPAAGWPIEISSGTTEAIGALLATLDLRRGDTDEPVSGVALNFAQDVPETGIVTATLRVDGLETLRPGEYTGTISLKTTRPNGQLMDVQIRPGSTVPVTYKVARPLALVDSQLADFGELLFDTSPNFQVDQAVLLPLSFVGKRFKVTATLQESGCADLILTSGEVQQQDAQSVLPLRLTSRGPVQPATCTGVIRLAGPDADYDVFPQQLEWQVRVNDVEWSLVSSALDLGDLQDAGARAEALLQIRFNGKTPFIIQMIEINATGATNEGQVTLSSADLAVSPVEITGAPNEAGIYEAPITVVARRTIPHDELRSAFYTGKVTLGIVGLEGKTQSLDFNLRSPSLIQRYLSPFVTPVYARLPWALCAWPLTLLVLLVAVARLRGRGIEDEAIDEAAVATALQLPPASTTEVAGSVTAPTFATPASLDAVWGNAEWGAAWGVTENAEPASTAYSANGAGSAGDPWRSSW